MVPVQPADLFKPYLILGERVRWTGEPKQGIALSARDGFLIPFSLLWGGFAIFWNISVWTIPGAGPDLFFKLWGLPFLIIGIYFIIGRFFHDAAIRRKMRYAVTDQRILVLKGSKLTSLDLDRLPSLELTDFGDGTGTIGFEPGNFPFGAFGGAGFGYWLPALSSGTSFFRIPEPLRVYDLIRNRAQA